MIIVIVNIGVIIVTDNIGYTLLLRCYPSNLLGLFLLVLVSIFNYYQHWSTNLVANTSFFLFALILWVALNEDWVKVSYYLLSAPVAQYLLIVERRCNNYFAQYKLIHNRD